MQPGHHSVLLQLVGHPAEIRDPVRVRRVFEMEITLTERVSLMEVDLVDAELAQMIRPFLDFLGLDRRTRDDVRAVILRNIHRETAAETVDRWGDFVVLRIGGLLFQDHGRDALHDGAHLLFRDADEGGLGPFRADFTPNPGAQTRRTAGVLHHVRVDREDQRGKAEGFRRGVVRFERDAAEFEIKEFLGTDRINFERVVIRERFVVQHDPEAVFERDADLLAIGDPLDFFRHDHVLLILHGDQREVLAFVVEPVGPVPKLDGGIDETGFRYRDGEKVTFQHEIFGRKRLRETEKEKGKA